MTPSAASARQVVILARAPSAQGKTRLTEHLPEDRARALRERLFVDTLAAARAAGYPVVVSFTPDTAREEVRELVGEGALILQRGDDLGARMRNAMFDVFEAGAAAVVLIGSDLPTLPPEHIVHAFDLLEGQGSSPATAGCDVVFGPAEDGGFYMVAARAALPDIFRGLEWSRADVLARVTEAARRAGLTTAFAPEWWDVDAPEDLRRCPGYDEFASSDH